MYCYFIALQPKVTTSTYHQRKQRNYIISSSSCSYIDPSFHNLSPVHVRVGQFTHEGVWAHHFLHSHSYGELSVSITKLVHRDSDHVGVVVEFDEALESLSFESVLHLC